MPSPLISTSIRLADCSVGAEGRQESGQLPPERTGFFLTHAGAAGRGLPRPARHCGAVQTIRVLESVVAVRLPVPPQAQCLFHYHAQLHERTSDLAANEAIETLYWLLSMHPPSRTSLAWRSQGTAVTISGFLEHKRRRPFYVLNAPLLPHTATTGDEDWHRLSRALAFSHPSAADLREDETSRASAGPETDDDDGFPQLPLRDMVGDKCPTGNAQRLVACSATFLWLTPTCVFCVAPCLFIDCAGPTGRSVLCARLAR